MSKGKNHQVEVRIYIIELLWVKLPGSSGDIILGGC